MKNKQSKNKIINNDISLEKELKEEKDKNKQLEEKIKQCESLTRSRLKLHRNFLYGFLNLYKV